MAQLLGQGTYGQVVKAKLKGTKQYRAIKIIPKCKVRNPDRFKREIDIMCSLVRQFTILGPPKHHQVVRDIWRWS